jgi:hypothetical protein
MHEWGSFELSTGTTDSVSHNLGLWRVFRFMRLLLRISIVNAIQRGEIPNGRSFGKDFGRGDR